MRSTASARSTWSPAPPSAGLNNIPIWPATTMSPQEKMDAAVQEIYKELEERVAFFEKEGKLIEAQRIKQRTMYDIEMMQELGYCSGIENYSGSSRAGRWGRPPTPCWTTSPRTLCCSSTRAT